MIYLAKRNFIKLLRLFVFLFSFPVFISGAEDLNCNCEKIECNPNCIKVCSLKMPLQEIKAQLINKCFGGDNSYHFEKKNLNAKKIPALIEQLKKEIISLAEKSKKSMKEECPNCEKLYKISNKFDFKPKKETCPDQYLKTYNYKVLKKVELNKEKCNKEEVMTYLGSYVGYLVTKRGLDKQDECVSTADPKDTRCEEKKLIESGTFKGMSLEDKNLMKSRMKDLWASCPSKCSFLTSYTTIIDPKKCEGEIDIKIDCTHKVKSSFFVPIYDLKISYEPDLKCKDISFD